MPICLKFEVLTIIIYKCYLRGETINTILQFYDWTSQEVSLYTYKKYNVFTDSILYHGN